MRQKRIISFLVLLMCLLPTVFSQSLFDDLINNSMEDMENKANLLGVNFKDYPYVSYYIANAKTLRDETVAFLIKKGANVNQSDKDYLPAIFYAAIRNNLQVVQTLIKAKADVNALVEFDGKLKDLNNKFSMDSFWEIEAMTHVKQTKASPLDFALSYSTSAIVKELLAAKADPLLVLHQVPDATNSKVNRNYTIIDGAFSYIASCIRDKISPAWPFFHKTYLIWKEVAKLPKAKQPVMPYADNIYSYFIAGDAASIKKSLASMSGDTIQYIPFALLTDQWDLVQLLYQLNSLTINDTIKLGSYKDQTLLAWTITSGYTEQAALLISKGAVIPEYIFYKTGDQYPVVSEAAYVGDLALVKLLVEKGASVADSTTLFDCHTKPEIRKYLVNAGMDPMKKFTYLENTLYTVLTDAALFGYQEAVAYYLSIKVPVNTTDPAEVPPLFAAVASANPQIVKLMIDAGANINQLVDCYGFEDFFFVYLDGSFTPLALAYYLRDNTEDAYKKAQYGKIIKMLENLKAENKSILQ